MYHTCSNALLTCEFLGQASEDDTENENSGLTDKDG